VLMRFSPARRPGRPVRTTREWNKYDLSVTRTVQIADAHEFLYGPHSTVAWTQAGARSEVLRLQRVRGTEDTFLRVADPYGKVGYRPILKFVTPDDPGWYWDRDE
jgi:hypothetical protein